MIINQKSIEQNKTSHVPHEFLYDHDQLENVHRRVIMCCERTHLN